MGKYIVFSLFLICSVAKAEFDINKGFVYENKKERDPQSTENGEETRKVEILRFYNESSKVSDPLTDLVEDSEIKFLKLGDKTLKQPKNTEEQAVKALSSASPVGMDLETIESALRHLENELGIKSMPVVKFVGQEQFNSDKFLNRIIYLEKRLGIYNKEQNNLLTLSERLYKIKEAQVNRSTASSQ